MGDRADHQAGFPTAARVAFPATDRTVSELVGELHAIAAAQFARERTDHTLQPTAIVSEAWLRLMNTPGTRFESPAAFRAWAAAVVRNILVDHARTKKAAKRGGGTMMRSLFDPDRLDLGGAPEQFVALHEALESLAVEQPRLARIVEMRFFGGMTLVEIARTLRLDEKVARAEWLLARAMLRERLCEDA